MSCRCAWRVVLEGRLIIAQQFIAGFVNGEIAKSPGDGRNREHDRRVLISNCRESLLARDVIPPESRTYLRHLMAR